MQGVPPTVTKDQAPEVKAFLNDVLEKVARDATPEILQAGEAILLSLAAIVICWTGLRQAFEGFNAWTWIQTITVIMIPWSILAFYDQPMRPAGTPCSSLRQQRCAEHVRYSADPGSARIRTHFHPTRADRPGQATPQTDAPALARLAGDAHP